MADFEKILLRLKEQLGVSTDKEAAELLGLSDKALNARKRRGVFPEDKLWALSASRPNVDAIYILRGVKKGEEHATPAAQLLRMKVLASLVADELHKRKASLSEVSFHELLDELWPEWSADASPEPAALRGRIGHALKVRGIKG